MDNRLLHAAAVPPGYVLVPEVPTEAQWGGLARDIVFWLYAHGAPHTGRKLHDFLRNLGREIPDWLEKEIPDSDSVPAKGTVAVVIYTAMLQAAKERNVTPEEDQVLRAATLRSGKLIAAGKLKE